MDKKTSIIIIEYTELNLNGKDANGLCVSIFFKGMGWYLGVIGNLHNDEFRIGKFLNVTPSIFNK